MKTAEITFKLGEQFEDVLMSGEKTQNVVRREADSLVQEQTGPKGTILITRVFSEAGMTMTLTHTDSGAVAKRPFKRTG